MALRDKLSQLKQRVTQRIHQGKSYAYNSVPSFQALMEGLDTPWLRKLVERAGITELVFPESASASVAKKTPSVTESNSVALTEGIRVLAQSIYLPEHSDPDENEYVFAYTISISNEGENPAKLKTRQWLITDGNGSIEEVRGPGVVGEQPLLQPGESFEYTSGCQLRTPIGIMQGTYQMHRQDGTMFDANIAPFSLATPLGSKSQLLN